MTFEPHPVKVLHPDRKLHRIFDPDDQVRRLESLGVDMLVVEPFSREFSQLGPEQYLLGWLYKPFMPQHVVVGHDFNFGANRQGSIDFLRKKGGELGFTVDVVEPVKVDDKVVSSSRIRKALEDGDVAFAKRMLGRHFYLKGLIEKGAGRGRKIGVPTANLRTSAETLPAQGVYAAWAEVGGQRWMAAVNIGRNPTFNEGFGSGQPSTVEAHLMGFPQSADIYGLPLRLEFVERLREERKFPSVDALVAQIKSDIESSRKILGGT